MKANAVGHRLIKSIKEMTRLSSGIKSTLDMIQRLQSDGLKVKMSRVSDSVVFDFPINKRPFRFQLKRDSSDASVFSQVILKKEYEVVIDKFRSLGIPMVTVIDAGANVGLTSIFFKAHYPDCRIKALEPEDGNFSRMRRNLEINGIEGVTCLKKGLWSHRTHLSPDSIAKNRLDWSFSLTESPEPGGASIESLTASDLMEDCDFIDLFKIDIEGAESKLFSDGAELGWLSRVKVLVIEIHDNVASREAIYAVMSRSGFEISEHGETTLGCNMGLIGRTVELSVA